jgi:putative transposase
MTVDPKNNLAPDSISKLAKNDVDRLLQTGLADFSLRELLGLLISSAGTAERNVFLEKQPNDQPNGFYDRSLQLGTIPVEIRVPRTRTGEFRPESLPPPYRRGYREEVQSLLLGLLSSSRSINAAKDALQKMGLSSSEKDLERVAEEMIEELQLRNSRPLDPDMLAVFVDGKYVELRESDKLRSACIYIAVGLDRNGKKKVLSCVAKQGRENLEDWKSVIRGLIERGLRRVMIFIQDDFSGLLPICQSFFPNADIQLCTVHMQRNAKTHLSKADSIEFQQRWRAIKSSWDLEVGNRQFDELCDRFAKNYPTWIAELCKKRPHYLAFLQFPDSIRRSFSTTNVVEAINGQLEIMRRNSGGYFHSEDTLKFKLGLAISSLEDSRWKIVSRSMSAVLSQLNALFQARFESAD